MLSSGAINQRKSNPGELPCPKVVVDARLGQRNTQGVFSACKDATKVVTVIDRDKDWECFCP
jgi:hypothetical protein